MPSERTPLARLADVLAEAGGGMRPTALELAELLWLARHMEEPEAAAPVPPAAEEEDVRTPAPAPAVAEPPAPPPLDQRPEASPPPRAPLHLPAPATGIPSTEPHAALLAPAPPMLRHPLALQRSLRPLKRRTAAPHRVELDERATADRIARLGAAPEWWLPVLRPAQERWLRLNLLHDTGPTMPVWRPLIRELHTALAQSGIFRTVTAHRAAPDGTVSHCDTHADGRTVTLLISDCMGPQWRQGPAGTLWYGTLRRWARRMPLAVVQPLPEHLWRDTALPTTAGRLHAPGPAAPNSALSFTAYDDEVDGAVIPLPVLEPGPRWLANWASLVAAPGGQEVPGAVGWLCGPGDAVGRADLGELSAEDLVLRFRASASPEAFRLAGHLALGRPDLPVMRLVQAALEREPRPQHLAEVILSGMLTEVSGPPGSYAFRSGVRELLLRSLPRTARRRTADLLSRLGALIDERAGVAAGEIRATTPMGSGTVTAAHSEPIATVAEETRDRLVGRRGSPRSPRSLRERYRILEPVGEGGSLWLAEDTGTQERVVVSRVPAPREPDRIREFQRAAEALKAQRHPNVVTVHDHGIEDGEQYVVMEHVDGIPLDSLISHREPRVPVPLAVSTSRQLAHAVDAMHRAEVPHGRLDMNRVVLLPDGTVKLTLLGVRSATGPEPYTWDLRALGELVLRLASGRTSPAGTAVEPRQLFVLPESLRPAYARACRMLLSDDLGEQHEGLRALRRDSFVRQAWKAHDPVYYSLLGPLSARRGSGQPIAIGSPQEQAMLAVLLLHHGRTVSRDQLIEGISGPRSPAGDDDFVLGTYASRLRRALGPGVLAILPEGGYALHTSADFVDVVTCQKLVEQAEKQRATGDPASARTTVDEALNLWHGGALDGVDGPASASARTRFLQLRLSLYATRAELDLELGEFERVTADLADLLHAHPSHEDFRRLYLVALQHQGRTEEALGVFEEYEVRPEEPSYEPEPEPEPEADQHGCVRYEFVDGRQSGEARAALRHLVTDLVAGSGLSPDEYRLLESDRGFTVRMEPYVDGSPLFRATMEGLNARLTSLGRLRLGVTFWQALLSPDGGEAHGDRPDFEAARAALNASGAWAIVALSEFWHYVEVVNSETVDPLLFRRFGAGDGWYRLIRQGEDVNPADERPVRGPFPMPYDGRIPRPTSPDHAIVLTDQDDRLTLADSPFVQQLPAAALVRWRYFEVDLRERRLSLTGVPGAWVTWRVDDPLKAAASPGLDLSGMLTDVLASARRRGRDGLGAALRQWSVPGYTLRWTLPPELRGLPVPPSRDAEELIRAAQFVLLGFDEVLARLYPADAERKVLRDIARLLVEERDPEDALSGQPLLPTGGPVTSVEGYANSLDLLRAFAGHKMERQVRALVDGHDSRAARTARPTPLAAELLRALDASGGRPAVVTDRTAGAVARYLRQRRLIDHVTAGVYGRPLDLARLMPHPHVLLEALDRMHVPASGCVLVASTVAELSAARTIGLPFIGYAPTDAVRRRLRAADDDVLLVPSLSPLLEAARTR